MISKGAEKAKFRRLSQRESQERRESHQHGNQLNQMPMQMQMNSTPVPPPPAGAAHIPLGAAPMPQVAFSPMTMYSTPVPPPPAGAAINPFGAAAIPHASFVPNPPTSQPKGKWNDIDEELNTNIISVDLGFLQNEVDMRIGEPYYCSHCKSILSHMDQLETNENGIKKWKCRYCSTENQIENILEEELPDKPILDYIIDSGNQTQTANTLVYCIDTSGSMSINVDSYQRGKMLTRLDIVKRAIISQVQGIRQQNPSQKVCLIEFNRVVKIHGDCSKQPIIISDKLLNDYEAITEIAKERVTLKGINETYQNIARRINEMEEQGSTALGPALLVSSIIAGKEKGSQVIVCTDGVSNIGLGNCDDDPEGSKPFYEQIGKKADEMGIVINFTTLRGCDANLQIVSQASSLSKGDILTVDPNDLAEVFLENLNDQLIATDVKINIFLHPMIFIEGNQHSETPSRKKVQYGNVKEDSKYQFTYEMRNQDDVKQLIQLNPSYENMKNFPVQIQIEYTKMNGIKGIRVISQIIDIAEENEEVAINGSVVQPFYIRQAAEYRNQGNHEEGRRNMRRFRQAQMRSHTMGQQLYSDYADDMEEAMEQNNDYSSAMFMNAQYITPQRASKMMKYNKK